MEQMAFGVHLGCFGMEGRKVTVEVMGSEVPVNKRMKKMMGPSGAAGGVQGHSGRGTGSPGAT